MNIFQTSRKRSKSSDRLDRSGDKKSTDPEHKESLKKLVDVKQEVYPFLLIVPHI